MSDRYPWESPAETPSRPPSYMKAPLLQRIKAKVLGRRYFTAVDMGTDNTAMVTGYRDRHGVVHITYSDIQET